MSNVQITQAIRKHLEQGRIMKAQAKLDEALKEYRSVLEIDQNNLTVWHQIAQILAKQDQNTEAIESYKKAI